MVEGRRHRNYDAEFKREAVRLVIEAMVNAEDIVIDAFNQAVGQRDPISGLIHHSDSKKGLIL